MPFYRYSLEWLYGFPFTIANTYSTIKIAGSPCINQATILDFALKIGFRVMKYFLFLYFFSARLAFFPNQMSEKTMAANKYDLNEDFALISWGGWTHHVQYFLFLSDLMVQWTIYSATTFLEKCRKVVLEKWFCKLGIFFSGQPLFSNQKKGRFIV